MSNYTKTTDFAAKDSLPTGDAGKIIRGAEFGTEFDNIATAIATKADTAGPTLTGTTTFDTLSDGTIGVTAFVDEDDMSSDSATMLPTQQSVKAYVDSQTTAQDLDFEADTGGPLSIDLDSETLTFTGGTGVDTSGAGNAVTFAIDSTVATLTDTQTLTNKTLTSPTLTGTTLTGTTLLADLIVNNRQVATDDVSGVDIDGNDVTVRGGASTGTGAGGNLIFQTTPAAAAGNIVNTFSTIMTLDESGIDVAGAVEFDSLSGTGAVSVTDVLDEDDMTSDSATALATQQSIKAYVDSQVGANNELSEVLATGNTTGGTDIAVGTGDDITFADSSKAIFGADSDLQIYHNGSNSYIDDAGTGSLVIRSSAVNIGKYTGETAAVFTADGSVQLRYDNSAKFETTNTGIDVTGVITTDGMTTSADINFGDNDKAIFGAGDDLQIYHDGSNSFIKDTGVGDLYIFASDALKLVSATGEGMATFNADGDVSLRYDNSVKLATTSTGIDVTGRAVVDGLTSSASIVGTSNSNSLGGTTFTSAISTVGLSSTAAITSTSNSNSLGGTSFTSGIDVTGTATMDGLVSSGDSTIGGSSATSNVLLDLVEPTSSSDIILGVSANGSGRTQIRSTQGLGTSSDLRLLTKDSGSTRERLKIANNGDISFYEDTGTTAKLFWDSSAESLGIGTTSPEYVLDVDDSSGNAYIAINRATQSQGEVGFKLGGGTSGDDWYIYQPTSTSDLRFYKTGDKVAIDSSGNLLVGTTDTDTQNNNAGSTADNGFAYNRGSGGYLNVARYGGTVAYFNRTSTDGTIIDFRKDGSTVGSIGTQSGTDFYITGSTAIATGLRFQANEIVPVNGSAGNVDASIDLGKSNIRFKDLYLSGGAYLGGTGSANKLDDYEEGTYVATLTTSTSGSITLNASFDTLSYTKVGRIVSIIGRVRVSSVSSPVGTYVRVSLPFNIATGSEDETRVTGSVVVQQAAQDIDKYCIHPKNGTSYIEIGRTDNFASNAANDFNGDELVSVNFTYISA